MKMRTVCGMLVVAVMAGRVAMAAGPATAPATGPATAPADCCDPDTMGAADTQPATQPGMKMKINGTGTLTFSGGGEMVGTVTLDGGQVVLVSGGTANEAGGAPATQPGSGGAQKAETGTMRLVFTAVPATQPGNQAGQIVVTGVTIGDGKLLLAEGPTYAGATTIDGKTVVYSAAPVSAAGATTMPAVALPPVTVAVAGALQALHDVDATLTSFSAGARKTDTDPRSGDTETRVGSVYYQKAAAAPNLAFQVDTYSATGVKVMTKDEIFEFVSPYFIHRDTLGKVFERTLVVKPGAVGSPLKLGSGLLPLPIGQEPAEMVRDFDITEVPLKDPKTLPAGTDAKDVIVLKLAPRKAGVYDFLEVTLTVDKKLSLPVMLDETKVDHGTTTFKLEKLEENKLTAPVATKVFDTAVPTATGWKVTDTK